MDKPIVFVIFIILVVVLSYMFSIEEIIIGGLSTFILLSIVKKKEQFINTDFSQEFSKYGNIKETDIDSMLGKNLMEDNGYDNVDNQDEIDKYLESGFSTFQPEYSEGISTTNNALDENFYLGEPETKKYTTAYNPKSYDFNEAFVRKQQQTSSINKQATDGSIRSTKAIFDKYFRNELDYQESKDWWSAEAQDFETNFSPYY